MCGIEVVKTRVEGAMIVVELGVTINMNTQTIEDAVSTMKRSHLQLLDMAYANLKFTGSPEPPLEHLKIFKSKAEARDPT